jgi:hypothetical protein
LKIKKKISQANIKLIIASIADAGKMASGVTVGEDRYILVRADPNVSIMLKRGQNGIVAYKSSQSNFTSSFFFKKINFYFFIFFLTKVLLLLCTIQVLKQK